MSFTDNMEMWLRLGVFLGILCLCLSAQALWPRRKDIGVKPERWITNFALTVINSVAMRIIEPVSAILASSYAADKGWGLFHHIDLPVWAEICLAVIILDMAIYAQHVATHKIPVLWRLHKVHHSDTGFDTTTALRFHPVEIILSMAYKVGLVFLLGPAIIAVLAFEVILNGSALFNHSNLKLPLRLDRVLRTIIVTPDMHRVHHSVYPKETDSNYGFSLSIWDRLFGTYIAQPKDGHLDMTIGLSEYQNENPAKLIWSLLLPFKGKSS